MSNLVAIVGRPNVGKSTLFNRLTQTRQAIVDDVAGTTRDRQYGKCEWGNRVFSVVDTGGWVVNSDDVFEEEIRKQVKVAIDEADLILFLVDIKNGVTDLDDEVAGILRRSKTPVILVTNKMDTFDLQYAAAEFYSLGLGDPVSISAANGSGTGELLDMVVSKLPAEADPEDAIKNGLIGRKIHRLVKAFDIFFAQRAQRRRAFMLAFAKVDDVDLEPVVVGQALPGGEAVCRGPLAGGEVGVHRVEHGDRGEAGAREGVGLARPFEERVLVPFGGGRPLGVQSLPGRDFGDRILNALCRAPQRRAARLRFGKDNGIMIYVLSVRGLGRGLSQKGRSSTVQARSFAALSLANSGFHWASASLARPLGALRLRPNVTPPEANNRRSALGFHSSSSKLCCANACKFRLSLAFRLPFSPTGRGSLRPHRRRGACAPSLSSEGTESDRRA